MIPLSYLEGLTGCMNSGKTSCVVRAANALKERKEKFRVFSYEKDRNDITAGILRSRDGHECQCRFISKFFDEDSSKPTTTTSESGSLQFDLIIEDGIKWVLIDEAQFVEDVVKFIDLLLARNIRVFVSYLNSNFKKEPWPYVGEVQVHANEITTFKGKCFTPDCEEPAIYSLLKGASSLNITNSHMVLIGDVSTTTTTETVSEPTTATKKTTVEKYEFFTACRSCTKSIESGSLTPPPPSYEVV